MAERTPLWLPVPTPDAALVMQGLARGSPADWGLPWSAQERALMTGVLAEIEGQPLGPAAFELVAGEQGVLRPRLYVATSSPAATQRVLEAAARAHAARAESEIALRSCPLGDGLLVEVGPAQHLASTRCAWSGGETSEVLRYHIAPGRWRAALEARGPDWDLPRLGAFGDPNLTRLFADAKAWGEGGRIEWVAKVASERVDLLISVHSETDE